MMSEVTQQRVRHELNEFGRVLVGQLFGVYPKKSVARRTRRDKVLYSLVERGQCDGCLHWFPYDELTPNGKDSLLCTQCASIAGRW